MFNTLTKLREDERETLADTMEDFGFTIAAVAIRATLKGESDAADLRSIAAKFVNAGAALRSPALN